MRRFTNIKPSTTVFIAVVALLAVGGGTATAARMISGKQIRNNSITGADVKNKSLTSRDFKGSMPGPAGPAGPQGPAGPGGPAGPPGPTKLHTVAGPGSTAAPGTQQYSEAECPAGQYATGGGSGNTSSSPDVSENSSGPTFIGSTPAPNGWFVYLNNKSPEPVDFGAYVICAPADEASANFGPSKAKK